MFKLLGFELPKDGDQLKHVAASKVQYILVPYVHLLVLRYCNHSQCMGRIIRKPILSVPAHKTGTLIHQQDCALINSSDLDTEMLHNSPHTCTTGKDSTVFECM